VIGRAASRVALLRPAVRGWRRPAVLGAADTTAAPLSSTVNSVALIVSKFGAMGLGGVFWLLAARLASPTEVGLAAGAVSAMVLCTQIAILGFGSAVILHLRSDRQPLSVLHLPAPPSSLSLNSPSPRCLVMAPSRSARVNGMPRSTPIAIATDQMLSSMMLSKTLRSFSSLFISLRNFSAFSFITAS